MKTAVLKYNVVGENNLLDLTNGRPLAGSSDLAASASCENICFK